MNKERELQKKRIKREFEEIRFKCEQKWVMIIIAFILIMAACYYCAFYIYDDSLTFVFIIGFAILGLIFLCIMAVRDYSKKKKEFRTKNSQYLLEEKQVAKKQEEELLQQYESYCNDLIKQEMALVEKAYDCGNKNGERVGKNANELVFYQIKPVKRFEKIVQETGTNFTNNIKGQVVVSIKIPIDSIIYYEEIGSVSYTSNVSGGGTSITGAVVGGVLGGDVGAIIGSRKGVKTTTVMHDTRETVLKLTDSEERLPYEFYSIFCKLIPEKDYKSMQARQLQNPSGNLLTDKKQTAESISVADEILKFKQLLDSGLITQDEYEVQKQNLLSK